MESNAKIKVATLGIISFTALLLALNAQAQDEQIIVDALKLRSAKSVTFYMRLNNLKEPKETEFKRASCVYKTENLDDITSLVFMLGYSDPQKNTASYDDSKDYLQNSRMWDTRFGVYLTFPDGSEAKYLFSPNIGRVDGYLTYPAQSFDRYPIEVSRSLPWYLVYWASHLGEPVVSKDNAELTVAQCKDEVIRTIYQRHYELERDENQKGLVKN